MLHGEHYSIRSLIFFGGGGIFGLVKFASFPKYSIELLKFKNKIFTVGQKTLNQ